jgi:hypothetical protein
MQDSDEGVARSAMHVLGGVERHYLYPIALRAVPPPRSLRMVVMLEVWELVVFF